MNIKLHNGRMLLLLAFLAVFQAALAQNKITLKGNVVDSQGDGIIGATVREAGSSNATVTDLDGNFTFQTSLNPTIEVSYVGCKTKTVRVSGNSVRVTLEDDEKVIDDIVVVGYGTQKKANLTGSVAALSSKDIKDIPAANTASLLQGRLPGVTLTSNGGQPGADSPEIRIRGVGTFGNNEPMLLIDGVEAPLSQMAQIAAADIDNVSVLKDAASAAIYGVRAANGVILVTTKRGVDSKPSINYSGSYTLQKATILPDYVNSYEWSKMYNESNNVQMYTAEMLKKLQDGSDPDHFANTDWENAIFRTAPMTQHNLSVRGGSKDAHYMVSVGYLNQQGIVRYTGSERFNFRSNVDAKLGIFKLGLNLSGSKNNLYSHSSFSGDNGIMRMLTWFTRPTVPVQYSNGYYGCVDGSAISQSTFKNPVQSMHLGHNQNSGWRFDGNVFAEVDIVKGLKFRTSLAYKYYSNRTKYYSQRSAKYDADGNVLYKDTNNSLYGWNYDQESYLNENTLNYSNTFGKHSVKVLLGHSIQDNKEGNFHGYKEGFATDNLYEFDAATKNDQVGGSAEEYTLQSFFGRLNYNFDDRYLFEFDIRHDGSSRMPKSHRYATFPSLSAAWIVTSEKFMQNVDRNLLNNLKLRASWGKLGNQEIGNYAYMATMAAYYNYYFGNDKVIGMADNMVANDDIRWETTAIADLGVDAGFYKGKINLTFDWFNKVTSDILLQLAMPTTFLGTLSAPYQNAGKVRNRGWELAVNYNDRRGDFTWNAGFSLSSVRNKIIDNKGIDTYSGQTINREGYPIGSYYGLKAIGIYRTEADLNRTDSKGNVIKQNGLAPQLGDIMYADTNDDGNITDDDRQIIGNPFPKLCYSFNLGGTWKNLDVTTFWQGVSGVYRYYWEQATITNGGNMTTRWLDRWSADNVNGSMPRLGNNFNERYSSFWLKSSSYLRLKNFEIGYTFNNNWLAKLGVERARVYFQVTNLLTFTGLDDYDPEKGSGDTRGDMYPNSKTYSFGVNINF